MACTDFLCVSTEFQRVLEEEVVASACTYPAFEEAYPSWASARSSTFVFQESLCAKLAAS